MSADESITSLPEAVAAMGALPVPVGPEPQAPAEVFVPRTERSYWVDIAAALNAAHSAGMPVGIDLDGTLTDRNAWSVVWDRAAEQWTVAGYEDGCTCPPSDRPEPHRVDCPEVDAPCPVDGPGPSGSGSPDAITAVYMRVASLRGPEGEFYPFLHREGRVPHDLDETGGV